MTNPSPPPYVRYNRVPDVYAPPPPTAATPRDNLQSWMTDARGRDQFAIRYAEDTEIFWNDAKVNGGSNEIIRRLQRVN